MPEKAPRVAPLPYLVLILFYQLNRFDAHLGHDSAHRGVFSFFPQSVFWRGTVVELLMR